MTFYETTVIMPLYYLLQPANWQNVVDTVVKPYWSANFWYFKQVPDFLLVPSNPKFALNEVNERMMKQTCPYLINYIVKYSK